MSRSLIERRYSVASWADPALASYVAKATASTLYRSDNQRSIR